LLPTSVPCSLVCKPSICEYCPTGAFVQSANFTLRSASIRAPELLIDVLGSRINGNITNLSDMFEDKFGGFHTKIVERMDRLERLVTQSSQRLSAQFAFSETPSIPVVDNEIQLKEAAVRVVSSARSFVSSRSTVADGSVYDFPAHRGKGIQDSSIHSSVLGVEKLQDIARWASGLESLAEGPETSIGIESSLWTATTNDSHLEGEIADDMFNLLAEKVESDYCNGGKIAEAEMILRKALNLVNTTNLPSGSMQKHNDAILRLASIYSEQGKFSETKEILAQLVSLSKVDLLPWEVHQKIKASHLLAEAHLELKELNKAEKCCKKAMRAHRRTFGKDSPDYEELLELLLVIHEAKGDAEPFITSSRDRSGRDSVASSYTGSLLSSQPTVVQPASLAGSASRVDPNHFQLRRKLVVQEHSSPNRIKYKPPSIHRKSDTTLETISKPMGGVAEVHSNLPRETPEVKHSNVTTSLNTQDRAKLETAFSYLETHSCYSFLSANFDPQYALKTAIHERHIAVAWSLLNWLAEVEQRRLENMFYRNSTGLLRERPVPFPAKLDVNYSDDKGPLLFQTLWPDVTPSLNASTISHQCDMASVLLKAGSDPNIKWSGVTPLLKASDGAQMDFVQVLLEAGADVTCKDKNNHTALYLALMHSDSRAEEAVCRLVEYGADVNTGFENGSITALTRAVLYGWEKATTAFLKRGAKTEQKSGTSSNSPLGAAVNLGFLSIAKILLDGGANIEGKSYETDTFAPPLYVAARNGRSEIAELLLARGADIEGKDTSAGYTPLSIAAHAGDRDIVKILLDHKADVNATDDTLRTPLHLAADAGEGDIVNMLLDHKADVNATDDTLRTPLHLAVLAGDEGIVKMLVEHGANVGAQSDELNTPLLRACYVGSRDIVKILLKHKADVKSRNEDSVTPLHVACKEGYADIVHMLLGRGAEVDALAVGMTPLYAAASMGHEEVVQILLEHNAGTQFEAPGSLTALEAAVKEGHEKVIKAILDHEAGKGSVGDESEDLSTSLLSASKAGALMIIQKLLRSGADIEARGSRSSTPLITAASRGYLEVVSLLLKNGAKIDAKQEDGRTALYFAARRGYDTVVQELIEHGAHPECAPEDKRKLRSSRTPLCAASRYGHGQVVWLLLAIDAKIEAADADGSRPLHFAAINGHLSVVMLLVTQGAKIEVRNNNEDTPLFLAAENGHTEVVQTLLESGADMEAACSKKCRPLHVAAENGNSSVVQILTDNGADVKATDNQEFTALHRAARNGHVVCVQILLKCEAEIEATGYSPLHAAAKYGHCSPWLPFVDGR
jgi:ankyrin repeat protein/tetratricopeptide (TPR) repeat protein